MSQGQASAARPRRIDGVVTMVLLILAAIIQFLSMIADNNMKSFGAEFGSISTFDVHMLTVLDWGGWAIVIAGGSFATTLRRYGKLGWPWALITLAALIAIALWSTTFAGS
jgi:hypothetical protein